MPRCAQPVFGGGHDRRGHSPCGGDRDRRRRNRPSRDGRHGRPGTEATITSAVTANQHRRIRLAPCQRDIGGGIVPRPRQAAALPQRDHIGDICVRDLCDRERRGRGCQRHAYSTLPGFMMPDGSSIALMPRISSIATLSLTSGSSSRLSTPMPCSAEIDPPIRSTIANTTALTSCQRSRENRQARRQRAG